MKVRDLEFRVSSHDKSNIEFNGNVRCLLAHIFHYYKNQDSNNVKKIIIQLEPLDSNFYSDSIRPKPDYENLLGIAILRKKFDFQTYWKLPEYEQKQRALVAFSEGIISVCDRENIECGFFNSIFDKIAKDNYLYQRYWKKKAVINISKNRSANIFFKYLTDKIEIYIEINIGSSAPVLHLVEEISPPFLHDFNNAFGKLHWDSEAVVVFEHKNKDKVYRIDTDQLINEKQ